MKRIVCILFSLTAIVILMFTVMIGCTTAHADFSEEPKEKVNFSYVCDWNKTESPVGFAKVVADMEKREAEQAAQVEEQIYESVYEEYYEYDESLNNNPAYSGAYRGNPDGLNSFNGVYDYNGHHETFYPNHAVYDNQLWVDDDGFFRTDDGKYVVASSDYAEGTEIEISQGTAVVMDSGPESGTVDVHTTWGR